MYNSENHVDLYILSTSPEGHSQEICQTKRIKGFNVLLLFFLIYTLTVYTSIIKILTAITNEFHI